MVRREPAPFGKKMRRSAFAPGDRGEGLQPAAALAAGQEPVAEVPDDRDDERHEQHDRAERVQRGAAVAAALGRVDEHRHGVFPALEESRSTMTKSSITPEKTSTALAKMAGPSIGRMTRRMAWNRLAPRSAAASSYWRPRVTSRACTMIAGQLTFQVTSARTSASVPRCTLVNSSVNTKNMATPKISSGMTKDRIIT